MKTFDLDNHYKQASKATTSEQIAQLRHEFDRYSESLTEEERILFRNQLEESAREEIIRSKALIEFVKEVMGMEQETA